ncbi:MAG: metalloprotease TldD [Acidobacteria bacterium]|nr:metalloprotease TldD [Acidobacteriota bacterium]MCB9398882.1 metalloprotease TldD [Acidobacteriota bacterium]
MLDRFGLSPVLLKKVIQSAMSRGGDFADVFCEYSQFSSLALEEGILKSAVTNLEKGVGIRVVKGEKTGYAYTERFNEAQFLRAAKTAAAIADDRGSDKSFEMEQVQVANHYPVQHPAANAALDEKIKWVYLADKLARDASSEVVRVSVTLADSLRNLVMADSEGRLVEDTQPMLRFGVSVIAERNGQRQEGRSGDGGRIGLSFLSEEKVQDMVARAVHEALTLLDARPAPAGMLPVILAPGDSGILLHEAIGHPLEADFNRKKTSAYSERMGEMVASAQCTICDDGTVDHDRGAINVDDELNRSERTVLIEEGRLVSYMYDELSARYFKRASTGNGRRESYRYQPIPRMRTTYMLPGTFSPDELIASTEKGIYCKTFKGGQVDISNGNFIFVPSEAYLIEDGKLSYPIKNLSLIGNGPDVLSKVSMVADDFRLSAGIWTCGKGQSVPVGVGLPTVKISEMTVGGQSE